MKYTKILGIFILLLLTVLNSGCIEDFGLKKIEQTNLQSDLTRNAKAISQTDPCTWPDVIAAYNCKEDKMKVVYKTAGKEFEIYNTAHLAIKCPLVAPGSESEECKKYLAKGFCESKSFC